MSLAPSTTTLLAAAVGALAGISGGVVLESFKRRQDRRGVAMTLAGVIETQLWAVQRRGYIRMFQEELRRLESGEETSFYGLNLPDTFRDPIVDSLIDKFGMLDGDLPARVIRFVQTLWAIRVDISRVLSGDLEGKRDVVARIIREDLLLLEEMEIFGLQLVQDLRASRGQGRFRLRW